MLEVQGIYRGEQQWRPWSHDVSVQGVLLLGIAFGRMEASLLQQTKKVPGSFIDPKP